MYNAGKVLQNSTYFDTAHKILNATLRDRTKNGVLVDPCEPHCNDDQKIFKGIFATYMRYVIDDTNDKQLKDYYR